VRSLEDYHSDRRHAGHETGRPLLRCTDTASPVLYWQCGAGLQIRVSGSLHDMTYGFGYGTTHDGIAGHAARGTTAKNHYGKNTRDGSSVPDYILHDGDGVTHSAQLAGYLGISMIILLTTLNQQVLLIPGIATRMPASSSDPRPAVTPAVDNVTCVLGPCKSWESHHSLGAQSPFIIFAQGVHEMHDTIELTRAMGLSRFHPPSISKQ
jgi:hypothetical protein